MNDLDSFSLFVKSVAFSWLVHCKQMISILVGHFKSNGYLMFFAVYISKSCFAFIYLSSYDSFGLPFFLLFKSGEDVAFVQLAFLPLD